MIVDLTALRKRDEGGSVFFPPLAPNSARTQQLLHSPRAASTANARGLENTKNQQTRAVTAQTTQKQLTSVAEAWSSAVPETPKSPKTYSRTIKSKPLSAEGFDKLQGSLQSIVKRIESGSLDEKWKRVGDYLDGYFNDEDSVRAAEIGNKLLNDAIAKTSHMSQPCEPRVAVCCVLLDQLLSNFCQFLPAMRDFAQNLRFELYSAVFISPPDREIRTITNSSGELNVDVMAAKFMHQSGLWAIKAADQKKMIQSIKNEGNIAAYHIEQLQETARYWRDTYLSKVFVGWRTFVARSKTAKAEMEKLTQALQKASDRNTVLEEDNKKINELRVELADANQALQSAKDKIKELNLDLQGFQSQDDRRLQELHAQGVQLVQLEERLKEFKATQNQLNGLVHEFHSLQESHTGLAKLVHGMVKAYDGPPHEKELRNYAAVIKSLGAMDQSTLVQWINLLVMRHTNGDRHMVTDFSGGPKLLDSYACLLNVMAPDHMTVEKCAQVLNAVDTLAKAEIILASATNLNLSVPIVEAELMSSNSHYHFCFASTLFNRFCDSNLAENLLMPKFREKAVNEEPTDYLSTNADYWKQQLDTSFSNYNSWRKCGYLCNLEVVTECFSRLRGSTEFVSVKEEQELQQYTSLKQSRIRDILPSQPRKAAEVWQNLTKYLNVNRVLLKKVYRFYCSTDHTVDVIMSGQEFWRFCSDSKIIDKISLTRQSLRQIFITVNKVDLDEKSAGPYSTIDTETTMTPMEWVEALMRIARVRGGGDGAELDQHFAHLVEDYILKNCDHLEVDNFKSQVFQPKTQTVLKANRKLLFELFKTYSSPGSQQSEMNFEQFYRLLDDHKLTSIITTEVIQDVFIKIQDEDDITLAMLFHEFLVAICAVAVFRDPTPYRPLHTRLQELIDKFFK